MSKGTHSSKVAVVGARGYSGLELCRLLLTHPQVELASVFATDGDWSLEELLLDSKAGSVSVHAMKDFAQKLEGIDVVFLATPNEASLELAPIALQAGAHVIDLSGAHRLSHDVYGLVPWAGPLAPANDPRLIANPGCYATSVLMAILPLLRSKLIRPETLVIDAKSGATGAGKKATENLLFTEVAEECLPYRVGKHQHIPEIVRFAQKFAGAELDPIFTTHLLPTRRGILSSIYARLAPGVEASAVRAAFEEAYAGYPFVRVREGETALLQLKNVVGTAFTHISFVVSGDKLHLFATIDNLLKGAASQAVENLNRLYDLPVHSGLAGE